MKKDNYRRTRLIVLTTSLLLSMFVTAHDPGEHAKESEAPQCEALASMDQGEIDMNDPVMQALYAKCKQETADDHHDDGHAEDFPGSKDKPAEKNG